MPNSLQKLTAIFLLLALLLPSVAFAFNNQPCDCFALQRATALEDDATTIFLTPIYYFGNEEEVIAIAPTTDDLFVWVAISTLMSSDLADTEPSWASNAVSQVGIQWAETSGTTQDPKLIVTQ